MKSAIIGLAALVAGCATTGATQSAESQIEQESATIHLEWMPGGQVVQEEMPAAEQAPSYSSEMSLPSETFSYDTGFRAESEEIVTMDPHGYTITCGRTTFIHTENQPVRDVFYNIVVNGSCENMLFLNGESGTQKWTDTGCEGWLELYEEFTADNQPFARESPVSESNTAIYGSHFNMLLVEEVDAIWRGRWNIPQRRYIIRPYNYAVPSEGL